MRKDEQSRASRHPAVTRRVDSLKYSFPDVKLRLPFLRDLRAALATFAVKIFNRQVRGGRPRSAQSRGAFLDQEITFLTHSRFELSSVIL